MQWLNRYDQSNSTIALDFNANAKKSLDLNQF